MKEVAYVVCLTPSEYLTDLRKELLQTCLQSLKDQSSDNWSAFLIGEEERREGNLHFIKSDAVRKRHKLEAAVEYLSNSPGKPKYVIRLDDDDIISPSLASRVASQDCDCYGDSYHAFYDLVNAKFSQCKVAWLPNTVAHKYEHITQPYGELNLPLLCNEHTVWHEYYVDKKLVVAPKDDPLYLRVLSPTSITSGMKTTVANSTEFDLKKYKGYLNQFKPWSSKPIKDFEPYLPLLREIQQAHGFGEFAESGASTSLIGRLFVGGRRK